MGRKRISKVLSHPATKTVSLNAAESIFTKPWVRHVVVAVVLFILLLLVYSNSFSGGFVFDNRVLIQQNPALRQATGENLQLILHHDYWWPTNHSGLYRPLTTLSYLFNYAVLGNGDQPEGYHWVNFLLHFLNIFLVYVLCLRLIKQFWPAVFIAAAWGVHPVLTESVTNVVGRADLLSTLAILSGFLLYLKSTEVTGWRRAPWLSGLAAVVAIGVYSKESAVAILGVIVLYEFAFWSERKQFRGLLFGCFAAVVPIFVMLVQRAKVLGGSKLAAVSFTDNPLFGASLFARCMTATSVLGRYLWLLVWPSNLSADYSYAQIPLATGTARDWLLCISVVAAIIVGIGLFKWNRAGFFFAALAFVAFIPVSNFLFLIGTIMAERFLYLPAVGFVACVVLAFFFVGARVKVRAFAPIALCLIIVFAGLRGRQRNFDWHDDMSLWTAGVQSAPNSYKSHFSLASALFESDPAHANIYAVIEEAEKSLTILDSVPDPRDISHVYADAASFYIVKGDMKQRRRPDGTVDVPPESERAYQRSLEILTRGLAIDKAEQERTLAQSSSNSQPTGYAPLYRQLARTYVRLGNYQKAYETAIFACELSPQAGEGYLVLAELFHAEARKNDEVVADLEYLMLSKNRRILAPLEMLFESGLDQKGCAMNRTTDGVSLNESCEVVHNDLCYASADLTKISLDADRQDLAEEFESEGRNEFGCSANSLP